MVPHSRNNHSPVGDKSGKNQVDFSRFCFSLSEKSDASRTFPIS